MPQSHKTDNTDYMAQVTDALNQTKCNKYFHNNNTIGCHKANYDEVQMGTQLTAPSKHR